MTTEANTQQQEVFHVFYSTIKSCRFFFKDGTPASFVGGVFRTNIKKQIDELNEEIAAGNPILYVDKNALTITAEEMDPIAVIKKRAVEEYLAAQAAATAKDRNMGSTDKSTLVPASTASLAAVSAASVGGAKAVSPEALAGVISGKK